MPRSPYQGRGFFQGTGAPHQAVPKPHQGNHRLLAELRMVRAEVDVHHGKFWRAAPLKIVVRVGLGVLAGRSWLPIRGAAIFAHRHRGSARFRYCAHRACRLANPLLTTAYVNFSCHVAKNFLAGKS